MDQFSEYVLPTGPIPLTASKVNGLFEVGGTLCKKSGGDMKVLPASPARLVLEKFGKWVIDFEEDTEPRQVICLGYNNSSFDDYFLLQHWRKKLEPALFSLIRRKVFTADVQKILKIKGKLADAFLDCGGTKQQVELLHDALEDCKAVATVLQKRNVQLDIICNSCRSMESVQQRSTNPFHKAGLITDTVLQKCLNK